MSENAPYRILLTLDAGESRRDAVAGKLNGLARLRHGWRFGEGEPASHASVARARRLLYIGRLLGIEDIDVFPHVGGGLIIAFYATDICLEATIRRTGRADIVVERGIGRQYEELVELSEASDEQVRSALIIHLRQDGCTSFELFTRENTTSSDSDSLAVYYPIHQMDREYPFLIPSVVSEYRVEYAST